MRQVTKKGLITAAAASGVLAAVTGSYAQADSGAGAVATHNPGIASGNTVQVPVTVPVNACGNTVNVVGLLNSATGNTCVNGGGGHATHGGHGGGHGSGSGHGGAQAGAKNTDSPGIGSGNTVQAPISIPVNACGNSVDVVGIGNPANGNTCVNDGQGGGHDHQPPHGDKPGHPGGHHPGGHHNPPGEKPGHQPPAGGEHHGPGGHPQKPGGHTGTPATEVKGAHREAEVLAEHRPATVAQQAAELAHTGAGQIGAAAAASAALLAGGAVLYRRARGSQG
ncbi:chaplin [Streptomyces sp. NPDC049585]|uniref:chaplin n=1 Tax=Streptomyces sp. NPDC049585 TaxID=3155154 RepID=UPI00343D8972